MKILVKKTTYSLINATQGQMFREGLKYDVRESVACFLHNNGYATILPDAKPQQ